MAFIWTLLCRSFQREEYCRSVQDGYSRSQTPSRPPLDTGISIRQLVSTWFVSQWGLEFLYTLAHTHTHKARTLSHALPQK